MSFVFLASVKAIGDSGWTDGLLCIREVSRAVFGLPMSYRYCRNSESLLISPTNSVDERGAGNRYKLPGHPPPPGVWKGGRAPSMFLIFYLSRWLHDVSTVRTDRLGPGPSHSATESDSQQAEHIFVLFCTSIKLLCKKKF